MPTKFIARMLIATTPATTNAVLKTASAVPTLVLTGIFLLRIRLSWTASVGHARPVSMTVRVVKGRQLATVLYVQEIMSLKAMQLNLTAKNETVSREWTTFSAVLKRAIARHTNAHLSSRTGTMRSLFSAATKTVRPLIITHVVLCKEVAEATVALQDIYIGITLSCSIAVGGLVQMWM
jgi:hypothetical protein